MRATVKSTKWYARIWPPERRKVKIMQALLGYMTPDIEKKVNKQIMDELIYGRRSQ